MIEKRQRADRYGFPSRLGVWLLGMAMFLLSPATVKAAPFDGQYQGRFSGDGSGTLRFSLNGGALSGSVSGSWGGDSISASLSGRVSADGRMAATVSGTLKSPPSEDGKELKPMAFSGEMTGTLFVSGPVKDSSGRFPAAASGTWNASAITTASGSWSASGSTASPPDPGTMEKPVAQEPTEYTWADYAKDFENYTPEEQAQVIAKMTPEQRAELERARAALKKAQKEETPEYTWADYAKDFEETYTPEEQAQVIAKMTPEQRAELERARAGLKKGKTQETDEEAWADYAKDFEKLSPEKQAEERKKMTPAQEAELDRVRGKLKKGQKEEATEYGWDDYAKDFAKLSPEKQAEERKNLSAEQAEKLDQLVKETSRDGKASDEAVPTGTPEATQEPEGEPKQEEPPPEPKKEEPPPDPKTARQKELLKKWDWYQSEYRSWENDMVAPLDQCLKNMAYMKQMLGYIKKDYEREFGQPIPGRDSTATRYPPQTPRQQEALSIYQEFRNVSEAYNKAAAHEADIIRKLREAPILNTPADADSRKAATKRREALEAQLKQIKQKWADKHFHADLGPLKIETIPDPQHQPLDPRKDRRKVDAMEYTIRGGAQLESGSADKGR